MNALFKCVFFLKADSDFLSKLFLASRISIVDGPLPGEAQLMRAASQSPAPPGHPERMHHALIAGAIGGYFVWGRYSALNQQIVLYLTSRVLVGVWKRVSAGRESNNKQLQRKNGKTEDSRTFRFFASLVWSIVMALWEESPNTLHPSLKKSMDEIYRYQLSEPDLVYEEAEPPLESRILKE